MPCVPYLCHIAVPRALCPTPVPHHHTPCPCPVPHTRALGLTAALPAQVKQERPPPSPSSQGMLDRSRMALCAFVFLCLSFNPLASLLRGSGGPATMGSPSPAGPGRSIMAESGTVGKRWREVGALGVGAIGVEAVEVSIVGVQDVGVGVR